jgi:hypothetical protein
MSNTEGPDFSALVNLPGLVLLGTESPEKVMEMMGLVRNAIVEGTKAVVTNLKLEDKYQMAAMMALQDGMREVSYPFEEFMAVGAIGGGHEGPVTDELFWEPKTWDKAVCCMPGMKCWSGEFANQAGRQSLLNQLEQVGVELGYAKELYDELNAENLRKAADARNAALAESRTFSNKLKNTIKDTEKKVTNAKNALNGLEGAELEAAQAALATLEADLKQQQKDQSDEESKFANLNK